MTASHYNGGTAQTMSELLPRAKSRAEEIYKEFSKGGVFSHMIPILCYSGMSGISFATAIASELHRKRKRFKFGMIYVRKENEKSHGISVEHFLPDEIDDKPGNLIFVDDFICNGDTAAYVLRQTLLFLPRYLKIDVRSIEGAEHGYLTALHNGELRDRYSSSFSEELKERRQHHGY